jgi:DNA-binding Xre family transcriptional regulator
MNHEEKILELKALAREKKIRNHQIATAIGLSQISISAIFTLQKTPRLDNFMAIEKFILEYK